MLAHVHPVISVDAAHLKSCYKGTISIYSGLTGNDDVHTFAFGVSSGNADFTKWDLFNLLFPKSCCSVSVIEDGYKYSQYVFVSDRAKGMDKSLAKTFPKNHTINCVHHIKQNVKQQFGPNTADMVFLITTSFSTLQEETLLLELQTKSENLMIIWRKYKFFNGVIHNGYNKKASSKTDVATKVWDSYFKHK